MTKKGPWTVLGTKEVYKNPWVTVYEDDVIRPGGGSGVHVLISLGRSKAGVNVLPIDDEGNVYLAKEFQYAIGEETINCVAGRVEEKEEPLEGAKRELKEELGIEAEEWIDLGTVYSTPQYIDYVARQFLARKLKFSNTDQEVTEKVEIVKVPLKKAVEMVLNGEIKMASNCAAILKAYMFLQTDKRK